VGFPILMRCSLIVFSASSRSRSLSHKVLGWSVARMLFGTLRGLEHFHSIRTNSPNVK
jgi:hypothetical protein